MKKYIIKPEFINLYGADANAYTVLTDSDVEMFAGEWGKPVEELYNQLIEDDSDKKCWSVMCRIPGKHNWEELNSLIEFETGCSEPYCETEEDYTRAVNQGWITYDGYYTTAWVDD